MHLTTAPLTDNGQLTHCLNLANKLVEDAKNLSNCEVVQLLRETFNTPVLEAKTEKYCLPQTMTT